METIEMLRILVTAFLTLLILKLVKGGQKGDKQKGKGIPGPRGLPFIGNFLDLIKAGHQPEKLMLKWREKFGDIFCFRLGSRPVVILSDYELINAAWHHPHLQGRDTPIVASQILGNGKGIVFTHGAEWKEHRRFILSMFRNFGPGKSSFEKVIVEEGERLKQEIRRHKGKSMDVSFTYSMASCNIISKLTFGHQLEYTDPKLKQNLKLVLEAFQLGGPGNLYNIVPFVTRLPIGIGAKVRSNTRETKQIWQNYINQHKNMMKESSGNEISDRTPSDVTGEYLRRIQDSQNDPKKSNLYEDKHLMYVVRDLYMAGTETVATTLRWGTLLLMTNPRVQKQCQDEIDSVVGRDRKPALADKPNLPFINATITEIQRVGDVIPLGLPHGAVEDVNLQGYHIPKGSIILANVHAVMMDPRLWNDPQDFNPSRHIGTNGSYIKPKEVIPFGTGRRVCIGEQLARSELFVWLTNILHSFNILPPDDVTMIPDCTEGITGVVRLPKSYQVKFEERE